jgi:hypothetical protein
MSSGGGGSGDIAGAGNVRDLVLVVDRRQLIGRRLGWDDVDGEVKHRDVRRSAGPALTIAAEVLEKYTKGDQRGDEEGEDNGPDDGRGVGGSVHMGVNEVSKLGTRNGFIG